MRHRTHGGERLDPIETGGRRPGTELERAPRVGMPALRRLGRGESGLTRAEHLVIVIVVPVVVVGRAAALVGMDVDQAAAGMVVDQDPRTRCCDGREEGRERRGYEAPRRETADHPGAVIARGAGRLLPDPYR